MDKATKVVQKAFQKRDEYKAELAHVKNEFDNVKSSLEEARQQVAELGKVQSAKSLFIEKLKSNALAEQKVRQELERTNARMQKELADLKRAQQPAPAPTGETFCGFSRFPNRYEFPDNLLQIAEKCEKHWKQLYPCHDLTYGLSGAFAYGEPSCYTMARMCYVIREELKQLEKPLKKGEKILDWGAGAGKWVCFARQLLGVRGLIALGIEIEEAIYDVCRQNLFATQRTHVMHADSRSFRSFCPARVVYNYDGGFQALQDNEVSKIHPDVIRKAFFSPTVDVVVSSRLNLSLFKTYFSEHMDQFRGSVWKCIFINSCAFEKSHFTVNIWFRVTPMHDASIILDKRMQLSLSGFFYPFSCNLYLC